MRRSIVLVSLVLACKAPAPGASPAADAGAVLRPAGDPVGAWLDAGGFPAIAVEAASEVKLDDPGREPRRPLRFAPAPLDRRQYRLAVTAEQTMRVAGSPDTSIAHFEHVVWMTLTAPELAGGRWRYELGRIEVPEQGAQTPTMRDYFAGWQPARGELAVDERGRRAPEQRTLFAWRTSESNEVMKLHEDLLDVLLPVLPAQPVGLGASWRLDDQLVRGSISVARKVRYQLVGSAARPRLRVVVSLAGSPQQAVAIHKNGLTAYDLASWKVVVEGEYDWDGRGLLPDKAALAYHLDFGMFEPRTRVPGEEREVVHSTVQLNVSLSR